MVEVGSSSAPVTVSVSGLNGFAGVVSVDLEGLPTGITTEPSAPFMVAAGGSEQLTFSPSLSAEAATTTITVRGSSGDLAHATSLVLQVVRPSIETYQIGSLMFLEVTAGNDTTRVGLETQWGGTVVEVSLNGTNFVNRFDPGREVQVAEYDGNAQYDDCAGCTGIFGWNPVQGGDKYGHGSPVLEQDLRNQSIFIKTQPIQWNPDDKGGGPQQAVPGDIFVEQILTRVTNHPRAFQLHYKITHFGTDEHANSRQEFPAVYVNLGFDRLVYYRGNAPWTNDRVTIDLMTEFPLTGRNPLLFNSEHWVALVNDQGVGLTVFVPAQYPYFDARSFPGVPDPTHYFAPLAAFTFSSGSILEGDIYFIAGDYQAARAVIYDLQSNSTPPDIFTPVGFVDIPQANSQVQGTTTVAGWSFDDTGVDRVDVFVDGIFAGTATYGFPRPDVAQVYPNAPVNVGYEFPLDSTGYVNGPHTIEVTVTDTSGNVAVLPRLPIHIGN